MAAGLGPTDAHFASTGGAADPAAGAVASSGLSLLAHELAGVVGQLGMRLEAWSVGPVSQQIGARAGCVCSRPDLQASCDACKAETY